MKSSTDIPSSLVFVQLFSFEEIHASLGYHVEWERDKSSMPPKYATLPTKQKKGVRNDGVDDPDCCQTHNFWLFRGIFFWNTHAWLGCIGAGRGNVVDVLIRSQFESQTGLALIPGIPQEYGRYDWKQLVRQTKCVDQVPERTMSGHEYTGNG